MGGEVFHARIAPAADLLVLVGCEAISFRYINNILKLIHKGFCIVHHVFSKKGSEPNEEYHLRLLRNQGTNEGHLRDVTNCFGCTTYVFDFYKPFQPLRHFFFALCYISAFFDRQGFQGSLYPLIPYSF